MKMVLYPAVEPQRLARIADAAGPMRLANAAAEADAVAEVADADAFFGKITPPILDAAGRLRWVQAPTVSLEHYVFPRLVDHPCTLTNMRGLFSDVIADQVMGYVLCFARNLHRYVLRQARRDWSPVGGEASRVAFATGPAHVSDMDRAHAHLGDHTLGVVGLGGIGAEVARRAKAFSMRVVAVDPVKTHDPHVDELWPDDRLGDLLGHSDYVVIAAPHTPRTEKLFRRDVLRRMKPTAYLINVGRGAIVDLADLTAALQADEIAGAALDVFETEPLPADSPLWAMGERVIVTPHVAGYSPRIAERHLAVLLDNVRRFVEGRELLNVADKGRWF